MLRSFPRGQEDVGGGEGAQKDRIDMQCCLTLKRKSTFDASPLDEITFDTDFGILR